uniref:Protrudin n=1 Tax=Peronospora matthiolae TaxID=2874970 RepID=A0AAV1UWG1_9STRA
MYYGYCPVRPSCTLSGPIEAGRQSRALNIFAAVWGEWVRVCACVTCASCWRFTLFLDSIGWTLALVNYLLPRLPVPCDTTIAVGPAMSSRPATIATTPGHHLCQRRAIAPLHASVKTRLVPHSRASAMEPRVDKHVHSSSTAATSSSVTSPVMSALDAPAGATLWEAEGAPHSIMFPYVRDHADAMAARVRHEDPRVHYVALEQVYNIYLYKRITPLVAATSAPSPVRPSLSSLLSSFSSLASPSSRCGEPSSDSTRGAPVASALDFRGTMFVPGSVDAVLDFLASETPRENYWVALNTLRDVKAAAVLSTARLKQPAPSCPTLSLTAEGDATAFPRWSRKYMATKFSLKSSAPVLDCCYAEYATRYTETNSDGHSRVHGFVYRRSVSERALSNSSRVSAEPLAKVRVRGATRFYIRDWLFDVIETQDPLVCSLVLTCSVFIPPTAECGAATVPGQDEFREFCTEMMAGARRALTHQWKDHAAHVGVRSSSSWLQEARCCTVCSAQFSLLRMHHTCRSCGSGVCSKCSLKTTPSSAATDASGDHGRGRFGSSVVAGGSRSQQWGTHKRECLLCVQFGPDSGVNAPRGRGPVARGRHLSTSMASMSSSISQGYRASSGGVEAFDLEQEEKDKVCPDLELCSSASISGSRRQRSISSLGSQRSMSGLDDDEGSDEDVRLYTPRLDLRATTSSCSPESTDSNRRPRSTPGIVLLSDIETLTLSGSFHRAASMSAQSSASWLAASSSRLSAHARLPAKSAAAAPSSAASRVQKVPHDRTASAADLTLLTTVKPRTGTRDGTQESSASTEEDEDVYMEDDLANFTLKLL